jgi:hypothetical protein
MNRESTKHGPHLDDALAREERAQAPAGSRLLQWDDVSPPADEVSARSELGRWIPRSILPADREDLLAAVNDMTPAYVTDQLLRLPADRTFETILEIWEALGHVNEARQ